MKKYHIGINKTMEKKAKKIAQRHKRLHKKKNDIVQESTKPFKMTSNFFIDFFAFLKLQHIVFFFDDIFCCFYCEIILYLMKISLFILLSCCLLFVASVIIIFFRLKSIAFYFLVLLDVSNCFCKLLSFLKISL